MGITKQNVKNILLKIGWYEPIHRLWVKRPDIRLDLYNLGYRLAGSADGLPLPPTRLIQLVQINGEIAVYLRGGLFGSHSIDNVLLRNGYHIGEFKKILDFGCGCGRIIRQWKRFHGQDLYGTDLNPNLIRWCQLHLGRLAEFKINGLVPPLDYPDEFFDFVYSISVFTHLSENVQKAWIQELSRVLRKDGLLLITLHGEWRINDLTPEEQSHFRSGQIIVKWEEAEGSNVCGAYHPEVYVRNHLARGFEVVDFIPNGAIDVGQDIYLLKKVVKNKL